jgi:hypothetical protein
LHAACPTHHRAAAALAALAAPDEALDSDADGHVGAVGDAGGAACEAPVVVVGGSTQVVLLFESRAETAAAATALPRSDGQDRRYTLGLSQCGGDAESHPRQSWPTKCRQTPLITPYRFPLDNFAFSQQHANNSPLGIVFFLSFSKNIFPSIFSDFFLKFRHFFGQFLDNSSPLSSTVLNFVINFVIITVFRVWDLFIESGIRSLVQSIYGAHVTSSNSF